MHYHLLRFIVLFMLRAFFGRIRLKGLEQVPRTGGLILAANHPSTFLDPLVVAAWLRRPVYFLANGGVFTSPVVKWLLRQLFMIPVYRKQDSPRAANQNQGTFSACYELLEQGGALVIFPEGTSEEERRLRPLKTGTARIALGAQERGGFQLPVSIVCVGISYTNPRRFQSHLQVEFDAPIDTRTFAAAYAQDPVATVQQLTQQMTERLTAMIVHTADDPTDDLVRDIEEVYAPEVQAALGLAAPETERIFGAARAITAAVHHFKAQAPDRVAALQTQLTHYLTELKAHGLTDALVRRYPVVPELRPAGGSWLALVAGLPIYLFSELHNLLPYRLPGWLTRRWVKDITFRAPINLVLGSLCFALFYPFYWWLFWRFWPQPVALAVYALAIPLSGYFAFRYYHFARRFFARRRASRQAQAQPAWWANLQQQRAALGQTLEQAQAEYQAHLD
ncbi:MAG: lysophospholipid acyltransferase family protein [Bernardetiaceae bacterium]|jgi:1-acyl-sn-glycerol-3-phosphate acyltransferase|nr:lysophospholipid acyltransferase family protein [Bernardetiaceae bacterium]